MQTTVMSSFGHTFGCHYNINSAVKYSAVHSSWSIKTFYLSICLVPYITLAQICGTMVWYLDKSWGIFNFNLCPYVGFINAKMKWPSFIFYCPCNTVSGPVNFRFKHYGCAPRGIRGVQRSKFHAKSEFGSLKHWYLV